MVAVGEKLLHYGCVLCISFNQLVARVGIVGLLQAAILTEVVKTDDFVSVVEELLNQISTNEAGRAGNQYFHDTSCPPVEVCCRFGQKPQTSTTTLSSEN